MFAVPPHTVTRADTTAPLAAAHPVRIAREFATRAEWHRRLRFDPVARWSDLLYTCSEYQVWLLSWLPGQHTDLHDHGAASGAFTVVAGALSDRVVHPGPPVREILHDVVPGQSRVFGPGYVHQVRNAGGEPAASIHVYRMSRSGQRHYRWDPFTGTLRVV